LPQLLADPNLKGLNVTIPFKEEVLQFLHYKTEPVKRIKACNCIKISDGKLTGYNTDIIGFEKSLIKKWNPQLHSHALILGTGGSAKAVQYVLEKLGIQFHYVSRKPFASGFSYEQLTKNIIHSHKLIINTTPLGMFPNVVQAPPIPFQFITEEHFLFDLIYNPSQTLFLKKGEEQSATTMNGYDMLVIQAEESWRIWNNEDEIRQT
jgi:shikimate dehydrogenase